MDIKRLYMQWRNIALKSEGDQAKFLTWCTYKVGVRPPSLKSGGPDPLILRKITPMCVTQLVHDPDCTTCRLKLTYRRLTFN